MCGAPTGTHRGGGKLSGEAMYDARYVHVYVLRKLQDFTACVRTGFSISLKGWTVGLGTVSNVPVTQIMYIVPNTQLMLICV
jgi:hypothetical protein